MKPSNLPLPPERDAEKERQQACATALRLLARREHSVLELRHKLAARSIDDDIVDAVVKQLSQQKLLSDKRFAHAYVRSRVERGYGPLRIQAELTARGIETDLTTESLSEFAAAAWSESAARERDKRFGTDLPVDKRGRAKQMRFLQQRGFTAQQIQAIFRR